MSICTDGIDSYSKKREKIEKAFIESFDKGDGHMSMNEFTVNSTVSTKVTLDDNTDVLKLPAGVLVRTKKWSTGGVAVHTVYLTDEQYFGSHVSLEKKA